MNNLTNTLLGNIPRLMLILLVGLMWPRLLLAAPLPLKDYMQDILTTADGLPNNTIHDISQTKEGYLWFATWEGVARYNGHEFLNFARSLETGLRGSAQLGLTPVEKGLWVAGSKGSVSYYQEGVWYAQPPAKAMINKVMIDSDDFIWLASEGEGVFVRQAHQLIAHFNTENGLPSNHINQLIQDENGRVWVATSQGLAYILNNKVTLIPEFSGIKINTLLINRQQQLLVGGSSGLYRLNINKEQIYSTQVVGCSILSLLEDEQGALWIGTAEKGLIRLSELGLEQLTVQDGLLDHRIISLFQDTSRSIWLGTHVGLMRLRETPFYRLTHQQGLENNYIRSILAHTDGSVWAGSSTGLTRIEQGKLEVVKPVMANGSVASIAGLVEAANGDIWAGTLSHGLLRIDSQHQVHHYGHCNEPEEPVVQALVITPDDALWVGTATGLKILNEGCLTPYMLSPAYQEASILSLYAAANGDIWVGLTDGALIFNGQQTEFLNLKQQLGAEHVFSITGEADGQHIWLTTDMGLVRYRYRDHSLRLIGREQGLPIDKYFEALEDKQGNLWLTSNIGLTRISLAQAHQVANGHIKHVVFEHFNEKDGMSSGQTHGSYNPGITLDIQGEVWVATAKGITHIKPKEIIPFAAMHLPMVIEEIKIAGQTVPLHQAIRVKPEAGRIHFTYAGLGFVMAERIHYRTKLEGFDEDWIERGSQNHAEYTNLAPGDYQFRVAATYAYKDWRENEVSVSFKVLPFYWQRPIFWLVASMFVLGILWLLLRFRLGFLTKQASLLARQVSDKTSELQQQAQRFEREARIDSLTGISNRRAFDEILNRTILRAKRNYLPVTLVVIDIDYFKHVNDTWSHAVGDSVLKIVADIIVQEIRAVDIPARWGGEEFTVLLADTLVADALPICERLRLAVMNYDFGVIDSKFKLTISLGVAQSPSPRQQYLAPTEIMAHADLALYQAKHYGRNQVVVFKDKYNLSP